MLSLWKKYDSVLALLIQESWTDVRGVYCLYKLVARKIVCIFKRRVACLVLLVMATLSLIFLAS